MPLLAKSRATTDLQRASEVSRLVELKELVLQSIQAQTDGPFTTPPSGQVNLNAIVNRSGVVNFDEKANALTVRMELTLQTRILPQNMPAGVSGPELLKLSCAFLLVYQPYQPGSLNKLTDRDQAFRAFSDLNATTNVWPYFRELVQSTAARMRLPPLILPLFRAVQPAPAGGEVASQEVRDSKRMTKAKERR